MYSLCNIFSFPTNQRAKSDFKFWTIHLNELSLPETKWDYILKSILTVEEMCKVLKFHFIDDRRRSALSILLQRTLIRETFSISDSEYSIQRTAQNKPYAVSSKVELGLWNFNVSHHGQYVCIASHSRFLVGVDVVNTNEPTRGGIKSAAEYISIFTLQFSSRETTNMLSKPDEQAQFLQFYINWSLKEAFVKALGCGLTVELQHVTFEIFQSSESGQTALRADHLGYAHLFLHDIRKFDWRFEIFRLDSNHIVSVAIGPAGVREDVNWSTASLPNEVDELQYPALEAKSLIDLLTSAHKAQFSELI